MAFAWRRIRFSVFLPNDPVTYVPFKPERQLNGWRSCLFMVLPVNRFYFFLLSSRGIPRSLRHRPARRDSSQTCQGSGAPRPRIAAPRRGSGPRPASRASAVRSAKPGRSRSQTRPAHNPRFDRRRPGVRAARPIRHRWTARHDPAAQRAHKSGHRQSAIRARPRVWTSSPITRPSSAHQRLPV